MTYFEAIIGFLIVIAWPITLLIIALVLKRAWEKKDD